MAALPLPPQLQRAWAPLRHQLIDRVYRPYKARVAGPDVSRADGGCALPPRWLILGVNNACNLHCKMCDVGLEDHRTAFWANLIGDRPQSMSVERFQKILSQAQLFRPRPRVGIAFTEPLLHPKIVAFVQMISDAGMFSSVTTNGYLLPRRAAGLVEAGLHTLHVSLDGPREIHNRIRGRRDSFENAFAGIQQVIAARAGRRYPQISVSCTVTDENQGALLEFAQALEPLQLDQLILSQLNFVTDEMAADHNARYGDTLPITRSNLGTIDLSSFNSQTIHAQLRQIQARKAGPKVVSSPAAPTPALLDTYYRAPATFVGGRRCADPFEMLMVRADGSVIPSHGRCFDHQVGSIDEQTLPEIWNGPRLRRFRQTLQGAGGTLPACARCCGIIGKPAD